MINYKHSLVLIFCFASMASTSAMEKKKGEAGELVSKDVRVAERLNQLIDFETDSIVMQRGKTILSNEDYNDNPVLLAACGSLLAEFRMYKEGEEKYYEMFVEKSVCEQGVSGDPDFVRGYLNVALDDAWSKAKKKYNLSDVKKSFYADFGTNGVITKEDKTAMAVYKKWMQTRDFVSTKFLVEIICKQMGERKLIEQETLKVIQLFKQYDNQ